MNTANLLTPARGGQGFGYAVRRRPLFVRNAD